VRRIGSVVAAVDRVDTMDSMDGGYLLPTVSTQSTRSMAITPYLAGKCKLNVNRA